MDQLLSAFACCIYSSICSNIRAVGLERFIYERRFIDFITTTATATTSATTTTTTECPNLALTYFYECY